VAAASGVFGACRGFCPDATAIGKLNACRCHPHSALKPAQTPSASGVKKPSLKGLTVRAGDLRVDILYCADGDTDMGAIQPRISVAYQDDATVVAFTDEKILEETDVRTLREAVESIVEQAPGIHLVLDFRHVKFLSSAVLGLLIRISKRVYERDGELRLCNIHPGIYEVFKITRLTNVFEIYEDVDSATHSFSER
jgi:anti-sigma B factor antagonist